MNHYRIKYKIAHGYYIQFRDWTTCWIWVDIGCYNDDKFSINFYPTLQKAQDKVKRLSWEKTQERTVYLYKG